MVLPPANSLTLRAVIRPVLFMLVERGSRMLSLALEAEMWNLLIKEVAHEALESGRLQFNY